MNYQEISNNPIVELLREEKLSVPLTKKRIEKDWNVSIDGFPSDRIYSVLKLYLEQLADHILPQLKARSRAGLTITENYLREKFSLTRAEYNYLKIAGKARGIDFKS